MVFSHVALLSGRYLICCLPNASPARWTRHQNRHLHLPMIHRQMPLRITPLFRLGCFRVSIRWFCGLIAQPVFYSVAVSFFLFGRLETAADDVCFFTASKDLDRRQVRIASWLGWLETCHVFFFFLVGESKKFFLSKSFGACLRHLGHVSDLFEPCGDLRWRLRDAQSRAARRSP